MLGFFAFASLRIRGKAPHRSGRGQNLPVFCLGGWGLAKKVQSKQVSTKPGSKEEHFCLLGQLTHRAIAVQPNMPTTVSGSEDPPAILGLLTSKKRGALPGCLSRPPELRSGRLC